MILLKNLKSMELHSFLLLYTDRLAHGLPSIKWLSNFYTPSLLWLLTFASYSYDRSNVRQQLGFAYSNVDVHDHLLSGGLYDICPKGKLLLLSSLSKIFESVMILI